MIRDFSADVVVGFGGYASAPVLWAAQRMGVPTVIQEQNSYAGVTNKILARGARRICVAYEGMERFFPADRIVMTGNPLRGTFAAAAKEKSAEALEFLRIAGRPAVVLVVGGSLGTRSLNEMMKGGSRARRATRRSVLWQTGKYYEAEMRAFLAEHPRPTFGRWRSSSGWIWLTTRPIWWLSRSGACTVSELCLVGKPTIFVPSPNVARITDAQRRSVGRQERRRNGAQRRGGEVRHGPRDGAAGRQGASGRAGAEHLALGIRDAADRVVRQIEKEW